MALSKFGKAFGVNELKKGWFPHAFNLPANQNYFGNFPEKKYYTPEHMSVKDSKEFSEWYEKQKFKSFNFREEIISYCESDVNILKQGCLTYRELVMSLTKLSQIENDQGIDPFKSCITLPSLCHLAYRRNFMQPQSIALINDNGFNPTQNYSIKQMLWLKYVSLTENVNIQHCFNNKEKKYGPYSVDGYCQETDTVYEFHGCYWHG